MTDPAIIAPSARMRLARDIVFREEDEGFFLYDIGRDILYQGNETGKQILILCDGRRTVDEVAGRLSFGPDESGYILDFLSGLRDKGLVEECP